MRRTENPLKKYLSSYPALSGSVSGGMVFALLILLVFPHGAKNTVTIFPEGLGGSVGEILVLLCISLLVGKLTHSLGKAYGSVIDTGNDENLRALQAQLKEHMIILDSIPSMVFYKDKTNRMIRVNRAFAEAAGLTKEEIEGKSAFELSTNRDVAENYWRADKEVIETGQPKRNIIEPFITDKARFFKTDKIPYRDMDGNIIGVIGFALDITEEKRMEEELSFWNTMLTSIQDASLDAILVVNDQGKIVSFNRTFVDMWGLPDDIVEKKSDDLAIQYVLDKLVDPDAFMRRVQYLYAHRDEQSREEILLLDERTFDRFSSPIFSSAEKYYGRVWFFRDITIRKKTGEALKKSQEMVQLVIDNIPQYIFWKDTALTYQGCNLRFAQASGAGSVSNIIGKKDEDLEWTIGGGINENDIPELIVMETDTPELHSIESRFLEDGKELFFAINRIPLHDSTGKVVGVLCTSEDITEGKIIEDQLHQSEKLGAVGQLAGGVAHDFNNILAGIVGFASLLCKNLESDEKLLEYATLIKESGKRAAELTAKLLAFGRKGKFQAREVNIHTSIENSISLLRRSVDKKITISTSFSTYDAITMGDPSQLENLFLNLAINSRDAMPNGGNLFFNTKIIQLDEEYCRKKNIPTGNYIRIIVTDTGQGIPEEIRKRIFEPFFTTKKDSGGTGLGLSSVYGTVTNHNGQIEVHSKEGQGTTFKIYLPLADSESPLLEKNPDRELISGTGVIFIVDDEDAVRLSVEAMLSHLGYLVMSARDGEEAINIYEKKHHMINLIILDMVMPKLDGKETYQAMKKINPDLTVLLSSGYMVNDRAQEILDMGVQGFLQKPYDMNTLSIKVNGIISKRN